MKYNSKEMLAFSVKFERQSQGLSQQELAAKAGVSANTVGQVETARSSASLDTVDKLGEALGVPPTHLIAILDRQAQIDRLLKYVDQSGFGMAAEALKELLETNSNTTKA